MRQFAVPFAACLAVALCAMAPAGAAAQPPPCERKDGTALRDTFWRHGPQRHPLIGEVLKDGKPIVLHAAQCARSPLQQLIVEVWGTIRAGGLVLLGEVHDNAEHHKVRGDILWPRLEPGLATRDLRPAAIIRDLRLLRPIYRQTAAYGHFGRELPDLTWESTDRAADLKSAAAA